MALLKSSHRISCAETFRLHLPLLLDHHLQTKHPIRSPLIAPFPPPHYFPPPTLCLTLVDATHDPIPDFTGFIIGAFVAAAVQPFAWDAGATLLAVLLQDRLVGLQGERV